MEGIYPHWDKPATKGDLIRVAIACSKALRDILAMELRPEDSQVSRDMIIRKISQDIREITALLDELGGSPELKKLREEVRDE